MGGGDVPGGATMTGAPLSDRPRGERAWWERYWPAGLFLGYLTFTVVLFAYGPIHYSVPDPRKLFGFLAAAHLVFAGGYLAVALRPDPRRVYARRWLPSVPTLSAVSSLLNIVVLIPSTLFMTGGSFDLFSALTNPSIAYFRTLKIAEATTNPYTYAALLVAPVLFLTVPLTLFFWRQLPWLHRLLAIVAIAIIWASGVLLGRNKGLADLFLLTLVFFLVHVARSRGRRRIAGWVIGSAVTVAAFSLFFALFKAGAVGRMPRTYAKGYVNATRSYLDYDNAFLRPFPEAVRPAVGQLYNYLTQGYYGLSMALDLDFVWTHGLGNSFFLHMVEERFLKSTFARENCYPARVQQKFGYDMYGSWHTIYPWLASDLSFPGVLVLVFLIGCLLALVWKEVRVGDNPFSVAMFAKLSIMLFYFNANNQILGFPVQFSSSVGIFVIWLVSRGPRAAERS